MDLTYKQFIDNILQTRGRFNCGEEYHECHHILPKCVGGTNDEENLIDLFAREHYIAHKLLALENPENYSLLYAWWNMSQIKGNKKQNRYILTAEEYEEVRVKCAIISSERIKGENHPMYGKHHKNSTKKKMSKAHKGKIIGEKNPMYGKHHSEEWKKENSKRMKEIHSKRIHPMAKTVICEEKVFNSIKECAEYYNISIDRMKKWLSGKTKMPEEFIQKGLKKLED